ncbi:leucine-rich repeat-containing protein 56 isoform X2 [Anser cygnoides]|uniref:leucine-rich repeat-containing protein 56 isoform X2 n=1 Tax=Anser cygnoides TaxID=8845 RepID=UPI0034D17584
MESERERTAVPLKEKHVKMELERNPGRAARPASAAIRVTDLSWRGNLNPRPLIKDGGELLMDEYLSPRKLKALTGVDDLQQVKALEMRVDTRENSLGNFGAYLPNLRELKLNNSLLVTVRDLGTTLSHLHVLWMARCGLSDLDGISSCSSLKELYIAYNNISDLSQLSLLDHLEVLDLEGNNIEDINQMQYLGLCCKLRSLTVEGNLICLKPNVESAEEPGYNYRAEVKKLIPHLEYLDEIPASQTAIPPSKKMNEDWLIIKESIKEAGLARDISWLDPMVADDLFPEDDSSDLTYGLSQVICGNPIKALRARRQKLGPPAVSPLKLCSLKMENPYVSVGGEDLSQKDVFSELRVWREQHKRCLQTGQQDKADRAVKITVSDEEEDEACSLADSSEEELREASDEDLVDSSCHSCVSQSSSDSSRTQEGTVSSSLSRCLIPSPPKSPSPASLRGVAARRWKTRNHRVRCLKVPSQEEDRQWTQQCQSRARKETSAQPLGNELALLSLHSAPAAREPSPFGSRGEHQPDGSTGRQRPISGPAAVGSTSIRPVMDRSPPGMINHHLPVLHSATKASERFGPANAVWPPTARATLQKLPDRPAVSTTSQSKNPQS